MGHFEFGNWVDFVRGLATGEDRAAMEKHLLEGCAECGATFGFLTKLTETAKQEHVYEAGSESLTEAAVRAFGARGGAGRIAQGLRKLVAALVYDSAADLRPAEARSAGPATRHLMYEAGQYLVDVRVDSRPPVATATGQIVDRRSPEALLADLPVTLVHGLSSDVVARTVCNKFGEFAMEYAPVPGLKLRIAVVPAGDEVEIELQPWSEESNEEDVTA